MTATNHVVMGALIATAVHNPVLAIPLAFAAHFALDSIPHFDSPTKPGVYDLRYFIWLAADCAFAASILAAIALLQPPGVWLLLACGVACASPDLMWIYYLIIKKGKNKDRWPRLVRFHYDSQKHTGARFWPVELSWLLLTGGLLVSRLY